MIQVLSKIVVRENDVVKHSAVHPQKETGKGVINGNDSLPHNTGAYMGWI